MTAEHVLTPDDRCPCDKPQTGSGYCSYECYCRYDLGSPIEPAREFKETAEDLNSASDVQGNVNPSVPTTDTDRLAEAQAAADVPDAAVDIAVELLERLLSGHLDAAHEYVKNDGGAVEDYSPHPASVESDARAIVAAVTPILTAHLRERLDTAEGRLGAVASRHQPQPRFTPATIEHPGHCVHCGHPWPCPDARDLGVDAEEDQTDER